MKTIMCRRIDLSPPLQGVQTNQFFRDVPDDQVQAVLDRIKEINESNPRDMGTQGVKFFYQSAEVLK